MAAFQSHRTRDGIPPVTQLCAQDLELNPGHFGARGSAPTTETTVQAVAKFLIYTFTAAKSSRFLLPGSANLLCCQEGISFPEVFIQRGGNPRTLSGTGWERGVGDQVTFSVFLLISIVCPFSNMSLKVRNLAYHFFLREKEG